MRIIGKIQDQEQELQIYVQDEAGNWEWSSMLSKEEWTQQIFRNIKRYLDLPLNDKQVWQYLSEDASDDPTAQIQKEERKKNG
ncbi:hypothetical protein [Massiliimalia massiliensis]|jgi:hypothetical protein|uniref:hypothetical protein n=1 Tax=Massiliimalia massiliensis TaxID=1852384 RepID=UPI0009864A3D|nr:hypothetical protein [Massiliimalia massiliensis]